MRKNRYNFQCVRIHPDEANGDIFLTQSRLCGLSQLVPVTVSKSHSATLFACLSSVSPARRGRHRVTRCESACRCKKLSGAAPLQVWSITAKLKLRLNSSDFTCCCLEHVCHLKCTTRHRFCSRSWYTAACESEWAFNALEASKIYIYTYIYFINYTFCIIYKVLKFIIEEPPCWNWKNKCICIFNSEMNELLSFTLLLSGQKDQLHPCFKRRRKTSTTS